MDVFKRILIFVSLGILACSCANNASYEKVLSSLLEKNIDLKDYSAVVIIPGAGCTGCISQAEDFFRQEMWREDHLFIFTNITSLKTLKLKMEGIDLENMDNTIIDKENLYDIQENQECIYPHIAIVENGRIKEVSRL